MSVHTRTLAGVRETLLFTLYFRVLDTRSPAPLVGDPWAEPVLHKIDHRRFRLRTNAQARFIFLIRASTIDTWVRDYLAKNPDTVVLHLGCGLDSRAFRLDVPESVEWFDVDFPDIIDLRRQLYPDLPNYHLIGSSVTDFGWLDTVPSDRPVLVVAEGLFMYLAEADVHAVLTQLSTRFRGEVIFDVLAPWVTRTSKLLGWGLSDPHEIERQHPAISLVAEQRADSEVHRIPKLAHRLVHGLLFRIPPIRVISRVLRYRF